MQKVRHTLIAFCSTRSIVKGSIYFILTVACIWHIGYKLEVYLRDKKTTKITATFYGEQHQSEETRLLQLPSFALCFSKLFTYNALRSDDINFLYNFSDSLNYSTFSDYSWKAALERLVMQVRFGSKIELAEAVFEPVFYLPGVTCWQTKYDFKVFASRAGQVNVLELIINTAVYDDIMVDIGNYSAIVYLYIMPLNRSCKMGSLSNSIAVSPGRLSTIGFQVTRINSKYRNKKDQRQCDSTGNTPEICTANRHRTMLRDKCAIDVDSSTFSPQQLFLCYTKPINSHRIGCAVEPCLYESYRFTKSEGYIKFDKKLSVVRLTDGTRRQIGNSISKAKQLDSQLNPWRRKSFLNIATGMDTLTNWVADYLKQPTGFKCAVLHNLNNSLIKIDNAQIPKVIHEMRRIEIHSNRFVRLGNRLYDDIVGAMLKYGTREPCFQNIISNIRVYRLENTRPHDCCKSRADSCYTHNYCQAYNISDMIKDVTDYGSTLNNLVSSVEALDYLSTEVKLIYQQLDFTAFVRPFLTLGDSNQYTALLNNVFKKIDNVGRNMFDGSRTYTSFFSFDDDQKTVHPSFQSQCERDIKVGVRNRHPNTFREIWRIRNWYANYEPLSCFGYGGDNYGGGYRDVLLPEIPIVRKIPVFVDLLCRWHHYYLALAESHVSAEPSFSLNYASSRFRFPHKYALYALGHILEAHDTSQLFYAGSERLDDALHRSCIREIGFPLYNTHIANALTTKEVKHSHGYKGQSQKLSTRVRRLFLFLQDMKPSIDHCSAMMARFIGYYKRHITKKLGPMLEKIKRFRYVMHYQQNLVVQNAKHKVFLINRLKDLARLTRDAIGSSGEEQLSHFLSRKGTILIGEIRIEMANLQLDHDRTKAVYRSHKNILLNIQDKMGENSTVEDSTFQALMSVAVHPQKSVQNEIMHTLAQCNLQKWKLSKEPHGAAMKMFSNWVVNVTAMVQRARRYTRSLLVSKEFMRKNMMIVSLYYDSLQVLTKTDEPEVTFKYLFEDVANAAAIYLRLTLFHVIILFIFLISLSIRLKNKLFTTRVRKITTNDSLRVCTSASTAHGTANVSSKLPITI